jgi:uncharacterized heparinase superfamily protein
LRLRPTAGASRLPRAAPDRYAIRFHLHPAVRANRLTHRQGVMLMLPNREVWTFEAHDAEVEVEESVYLAGLDGPRRAVQIVVHANVRQSPRISWSFVQLDPAETGSMRRFDEEPELPL